jgi:putative MATE family efflux protein
MRTNSPSISRQLFQTTWPMLFGVVSLMSFQLIDSAFIGQLGILPLAAQGFTLPLQMVIIGIQVGLGIATTSVISRALGEKKKNYAKQLGSLILVLGTGSLGLLSLIIYLIRHPLLELLSAPQSVYSIIDSYWIIWLISAWFGAILYFLYSVCRSNGNTMLPGSMMVITSLINLILDPIFIFTLDLGIQGAAFATICAFGCGILIVAPKILNKHWMIFDWHGLDVITSLKSIFHIMGPAMISQLLPPLSSMLATKLLASYGTAAVAAWAVASRFEFFAIVSVLALTMSMPPMVGRLLGEKKFDDIGQLISIAIKYIIIFQTLIAFVTYGFSSPLVSLMASDTSVQKIISWHLTIVPFSLASLGVCMLLVSICNALAHSYTALTISALRLFAFFLPCLWLGSLLFGVHGLFYGAFLGNVLAGITAWLIYRRVLLSLR